MQKHTNATRFVGISISLDLRYSPAAAYSEPKKRACSLINLALVSVSGPICYGRDEMAI